jgi:hypothetical protein
MDVTKPYEFIGFGAMDVTKPYEFIGVPIVLEADQSLTRCGRRLLARCFLFFLFPTVDRTKNKCKQ